MLAAAVKNTILMTLIILIIHFFIKNSTMEHDMNRATEVFCAASQPEAADIRQAMHDELKRFVFEDESCDPMPSCPVASVPPCESSLPPPPCFDDAPTRAPDPPLAAVGALPLSCNEDAQSPVVFGDVSCFDSYDSCYATW